MPGSGCSATIICACGSLIIRWGRPPSSTEYNRPWYPRAEAILFAVRWPCRGAQAPTSLPNLVALARRWIAESGLPRQDRLGRARYLEQKLASGRYQYSLAGQHRDTRLDPIEDFLTKHPQGHCEYFATALTLMLRSQGIPARLVVGYKCDEWNERGRLLSSSPIARPHLGRGLLTARPDPR